MGQVIQHMWDQEKEHKKKFDELLPKYRARPTVMLPIWNVAGFVLGAGMLFGLLSINWLGLSFLLYNIFLRLGVAGTENGHGLHGRCRDSHYGTLQ